MTYAIVTEALHFRAGKGFALHDLNLRVPTGSVYGFLGANGSGKTTTLSLLLGMRRADSGSITILGEPMPARYAMILARTGYVPERPHVYPVLTARETIDFHASFHERWSDKWADELSRLLRIPMTRPIANLSKGETAKLMMVLALAQQPELLVLDEPTDGLDPVARREVRQALLTYVASTKASVIISSHLVHELEKICDWVGVMDNGRLLTQLPMTELRSGVKRLRLDGGSQVIPDAPFEVLSRATDNGSEQWIVRGWEPEMNAFLADRQIVMRGVDDLDLEEAFVELLQNTRVAPAATENSR
jgi:ABC-2 type transport system ATP-binding protein